MLLRELPREFPSQTFMRKMLLRGQVLVDGTPVEDEATVLSSGSRIEYVLAAKPRHHHTRSSGLGPPSLRLQWAHVDEYMAVCVKPQGISTQGDESATRLRNAVGWDLPPPNEQPDALAVPRFVHRIDKMTGGLLIFARTGSANASLTQAFAQHDAEHDGSSKAVQKTYLAVVVGKLEGSGTVDAPVSGKRAVTRWHALSCVRSAESGWVTTVRLHPLTGRNHQLRRHLALSLCCPILGDSKYLSYEARASEYPLHLWASGLTLSHPATGEPLSLTIDEPPAFGEARAREEAAAAELSETAWAERAAEAQARRQRAAAACAASNAK